MTKQEIINQVAAGKLSVDEAAKLLTDLETSRRGAIQCKVGTEDGPNQVMSRDDVLQKLAKGELSVEQANKQLDEWQNVLEQLLRFAKQMTVEVTVYRQEEWARFSQYDRGHIDGAPPSRMLSFSHTLTSKGGGSFVVKESGEALDGVIRFLDRENDYGAADAGIQVVLSGPDRLMMRGMFGGLNFHDVAVVVRTTLRPNTDHYST